jgi:hypothetical protein
MAKFGLVARASWMLGAVIIVLAAAPARVQQPAAKAGSLPEADAAPVAESATVLAKLEPGLWQVRALDGGTPTQSMCVADPAMLMQLQHGQAACSRRIVAADERGVTIHYTCPANGFGRTSLRLDTPRMAKIETQGIIGKIPFEQRVEIQRMGECPAAKTTAPR